MSGRPPAAGREPSFSAARSNQSLAQSYRLQNDLYRTMLDAVSDWVVITDLKLRIVQANAPALRDFGIAELLPGKARLPDFLAEPSPPDAMELLAGGGDAKTALRSFTAVAARAKLRRLVAVHALREGGRVYSYLFTGGAAIESSGADFALEMAERMVKGLPLPCVLYDFESGGIVGCNRAFQKLLGRAPGEVEGRDLGELAGGPGPVEGGRGPLRSAGFYLAELELRRGDGGAVRGSFIAVSFALEGGRKHLAVGIFRDLEGERAKEARVDGLLGGIQEALAAVLALRGAGGRGNEPLGLASLSGLGATPQQTRIGALLMEGRTTKEIAAELGLSDSTVKNHLLALFKRLGVQTRIEFIKLTAERGIQPF